MIQPIGRINGASAKMQTLLDQRAAQIKGREKKKMFSAYEVQATHREEILDRIREEEKKRGMEATFVPLLLDWIDANAAGKATETVVSQFFEGVK